MTPNLLENIQLAVETAGSCGAEHIESLAVVEMFGPSKVWEGIVERFRLHGHIRAKYAYGWAWQDGKETRYVAVLEIPPVNSANTAVRAAIAAGAQK